MLPTASDECKDDSLDMNLGYFADRFRFLRFGVAAEPVPFEVPADVELCLRVRLRPTGLSRRLLDGGFTFAATAPSVEPIERATLTRKSPSLAAGLRFLIFIFHPEHPVVCLKRLDPCALFPTTSETPTHPTC